MANTLRIKRRTSGGTGAPSSLANAELAYNEVDDVLYYGKGTGGVGGSATTIPAIAGPGAFLTLSTTQTVSGNKTFTGSVDLTGSNATAATATTSDSSTKIATTAFVKAQNYITGNQTITFSGDASGSGTTSVTLTLANSGVTAGTYTKITVDAKGRATTGTTLAATDIPTLTAAKISDFDTQVRTSRLDQMAAPTASVSLNSQKITNLATPTADSDAATKAYVDASRSGLDVKASVRAATTANITLSGTQTIDGVSLIAGDRVLVKDQSTASGNGIYVVAASTWSRSTDADTDAEVHAGMFTFVEEGTVNADSGWVLSTNNPIVVGSTSLTFAQFSGAGQITAGAGLTKTGNTIDAVGTSNRITVNADSIDIASTYVGQTSITTLGTIATGTWNGTTIAVANGGTGATTLTGLVKGNGTSAFSAAVAGTDYHDTNSTIDGGSF
jgi:phage-related tail fiber protein